MARSRRGGSRTAAWRSCRRSTSTSAAPRPVPARHPLAGSVVVVQDALRVATRGRGFYDVTAEVARLVARGGVTTGLCTVFVQHTSASLLIQENADPSVRRDLERWIAGLA